VNVEAKLKALGESAQYDICSHCSSGQQRVRSASLDRWIYPAVMPDGKQVKLLKVLQTNSCQNNCSYCATRCSRDFKRATIEPEELVKVFDGMRRARKVNGLFLSSGVQGSAEKSMARIIDTAQILRSKYAFRGYIHLKVLPGASHAAIEAAARIADRISINLEAPGADYLRRIAPDKDYEQDLWTRLRWISELSSQPGFRAKRATTQFVVGAAGESDSQIVGLTWRLYSQLRLGRVYYSAYQRPDAAVGFDAPPVPLMREHRLYQADFLFRKYKFQPAEIAYDHAGNLPLDVDPKALWAQHHPERFPVELNTASREELLRVPGIGPIAVERIITMRAISRIHAFRDLTRLGARLAWAAPYILLNGRRPPAQGQRQLWQLTA
jgi:predicted DNA-binding helix-hairpin-helix protein